MPQRRTYVIIPNGEVHGSRCADIRGQHGQITWDAASAEDAIAQQRARRADSTEADYSIMPCVERAARVPSGSHHYIDLASGSKLDLITKLDEYGRGYSHALTATRRDGQRVTIHRNLTRAKRSPLFACTSRSAASRASSSGPKPSSRNTAQKQPRPALPGRGCLRYRATQARASALSNESDDQRGAQVRKRSQSARTNGDFLRNSPNGFPSSKRQISQPAPSIFSLDAPEWWSGSDAMTSLLSPQGMVSAVTRATSLIVGPLAQVRWYVRPVSERGTYERNADDLYVPRWLVGPDAASSGRALLDVAQLRACAAQPAAILRLVDSTRAVAGLLRALVPRGCRRRADRRQLASRGSLTARAYSCRRRRADRLAARRRHRDDLQRRGRTLPYDGRAAVARSRAAQPHERRHRRRRQLRRLRAAPGHVRACRADEHLRARHVPQRRAGGVSAGHRARAVAGAERRAQAEVDRCARRRPAQHRRTQCHDSIPRDQPVSDRHSLAGDEAREPCRDSSFL